jgi:hypothetical protein
MFTVVPGIKFLFQGFCHNSCRNERVKIATFLLKFTIICPRRSIKPQFAITTNQIASIIKCIKSRIVWACPSLMGRMSYAPMRSGRYVARLATRSALRRPTRLTAVAEVCLSSTMGGSVWRYAPPLHIAHASWL